MLHFPRWTVMAVLLVAVAACAKRDDKPIRPGPAVETVVPSEVPAETIARAVATPVQDSGLGASDLAALRADYPLATCPVDGKPLGSMGDPVEVIVQGRLVRLCCAACIPDVERDAAAVFGRIDAAKQAALGS